MSGAATDVAVVAETNQSVRVEVLFTPDLTQLTPRSTVDSQTVLARTITLVVPPAGRVSLGAVAGESLIPVSIESGVTVISASAPLVSVSSSFEIRGRRLVNAIICPVVSGSIYSRVTFTLQFDGSPRSLSTTTPDPVFDSYFEKTTANFAQGRNWRSKTTELTSSLAQHAPGPFSSGAVFVKLAVNQSGIYKVTGAQLAAAGVALAGISGSDLRLFNGGGLQNEFLNNRPRPQFGEVAISVTDGNDGSFDAADQIIFYGDGVNRWTYANGVEPKFTSHHFDDKNIYWLAIGGTFGGAPLRMATIDGSATGTYDFQVSQGKRYIHIEQDSTLSLAIDGHLTDYYEWYWSSSSSVRLFVPTPNVVPATSNSVAVSGLTSFISPNGYVTTKVNGVTTTSSCNPGGCTGTTSALTTGLNQIDLTLSPLNPGTTPSYFNWIEFGYTCTLAPVSDALDVTLGTTAGRALVELEDPLRFSRLFMVDNAAQPVEIVDVVPGSVKLAFEIPLTAGGPNRLVAVPETALKTPLSITKVTPVDLYADLSPADLIVVTIPQFSAAMSEYVDYRAQRGITTRVVSVNDVMDNFSWGVYDPTAIRDFLKFAYENWTSPAPSAVLFVGDANFDYLNHRGGNEPNYVPSYNMPISFDPRGGDDNYVYFGNYGLLDGDTTFPGDRGYDLLTARWPVKGSSEIRAIIAKVKQYESGSNRGVWRKNILSVADDEFAGADNTQGFHVTDALALERGFFPRALHLERQYLWDFPVVNGERPAVNDAIINAINKGALVVNYVGHGNPDVWAHERVLKRTSDLTRLSNDGRLPLIYAASCDINHYDDPQRESMGEDFLAMAGRGAIGVIAAVRLVYSFDNAALSKEVYRHLMGDTGTTICEALFAGKVARQYTSGTPFSRANDRAYLLFGDPFLKLGLASKSIVFDQKPDSLVALGVQTVAGRVVDQDGTTLAYDGTAYVDVFDSDRPRSHKVAGTDQVVNYSVSGPNIYHGSVAVTGGQFSFQFVTPLDVNFGGSGARIEVYAVADTSIDALGLVDSLSIRNTAAASSDSTGPSIAYTVSGRSNFVSGDHVLPSENLVISLSDPSGINLTSGLGHGITIEVDGQSDNVANLSAGFAYEPGSFTSGSANFGLAGLTSGDHTLKIKAWDNANNFAVQSLTVSVVATGDLAIHNLLNYPNPMAEATTFYFELTNPAERFTLEIFTLSGRKIKSMERMDLSADNYPNDAVSIGWDGRDMVGDRVATGVYIYKATAVPQSGGRAVESFGKVVLVN